MFDEHRWTRLKAGLDCPICQANARDEREADRWVVTLPSGRVTLQDDADFRGYCILAYRRHATELFELSLPERGQLIHDVARVAQALRDTCRPLKINYEILGNEVPHVHVHIVPRYAADGCWGRPIWLRPPDAQRSLPHHDFESLRSALRAALSGP
jgi:diadenosine tetraphosphate (Ap4A) HIT family hydrolase